ncbi:MAG: hypothetical protein GC154_12015 [bacterium]|nr:hypothetical protein [bacterium]
MYSLQLSPQAEASIEEIYVHGYIEFGSRIADEYDQLIRQAIRDIHENPLRPGSRPVAGKNDGLRRYPLFLSKKRAKVTIRTSRHEALYYVLEAQQLILIADILRNNREESRDRINRADLIS